VAPRPLQPVSGVIPWPGPKIFALYLFHLPILSFSTVFPADPSSALQMIALVAVTILVVTTIGRLCEQSKGAYERLFLFLWERCSLLLPAASARVP
jgi:hypothetical protein